MIKPDAITNFARTESQLQQFYIFCWFSKAAKAEQLAPKLNSFFEDLDELCEEMQPDLAGATPFRQIWYVMNSGEDFLQDYLKQFKVGKYEAFAKGFFESLTLSLPDCSLEQLCAVSGIGKKIARMFLLHSRPSQKYICLDTHLLKEARLMGVDAPKQSPQDGRYEEIESEMISKLEKQGVADFAKFDLDKWTFHANI